jgi:hypothetical protein
MYMGRVTTSVVPEKGKRLFVQIGDQTDLTAVVTSLRYIKGGLFEAKTRDGKRWYVIVSVG